MRVASWCSILLMLAGSTGVAWVLWPKPAAALPQLAPVVDAGSDEPSLAEAVARDPRDSEDVAETRADIAGRQRVTSRPVIESNASLLARERSGHWELTVEVVDASGLPIPSALVTLRRVIGDADLVADPLEVRAHGFTRADGRVVLAGDVIGEYVGHATAPAARPELAPTTWRVEVVEGVAFKSTVLNEGLVIAGTITWVRGRPEHAEPMRLDAVAVEGGERVSVAVDDGAFCIRGLLPGSYALHGAGGCSPFVTDPIVAGTSGYVLLVKSARDASDVGLHLGEIHGRVDGPRVDFVRAERGRIGDPPGAAGVLLDHVGGAASASRSHYEPDTGAFHLVGLEPGAWFVTMRRDHAFDRVGPFEIHGHEVLTDVVLR